ncbi:MULTISPECIES: Hsp70 family protein [unclassified Chelatococcus]|uniref:Hsp70 family protein n=1 Tax=unclassified Chelatococcus TaxID=2638111 RepID=UPI00224BD329|nr:Hsp70 family protein [Chelatococcus sp.]MCO5078149.1 Hsp70 family protein [Chelatococcus sp.]CAH1656924.1 putative heat shock protein YegD [Hyphomicrobiales bacterium]CAH1684584.1 putative heat shock protein YegD [Hyphomicrobiales bacterium]
MTIAANAPVDMIEGEVAAIGIDFGTTNSVVALAHPDGRVTTRSFPTHAGPVDAYRSALMFWREGRPPASTIRHASGPDALNMAIDMTSEHRFLQSLKTHLSSRAFQDTRLFGKLYRLEELIGVFLGDLTANLQGLDTLPLVSGRPVVFAGDRPDEELALRRLTAAYAAGGMAKVDYAYEPLGAAYWYARDLTRPETMLVADFGGGTSDFSVMRFEPGGDAGRLKAIPLSHAGVGVAGDSFDYRIIEHAVSPRLGKNTRYRSFDKWLPVPAHYHAAFAQWHRLSLMKSRETMAELKALIRDSEDPAKLEDLLAVIEYDLGYALYRAVSAAKIALSSADEAVLSFNEIDVKIEATIKRADFDRWIADDVAAIEGALDEALARAGIAPEAIEAVFITGGTSHVPSVRALFDRRFGRERIHVGDAFRSVASGLALIALDRQRAVAAA